ncbi:MAG: hypothetical protein ACTH05_10120 [Yaniella sp.]
MAKARASERSHEPSRNRTVIVATVFVGFILIFAITHIKSAEQDRSQHSRNTVGG